jgi:hypothetical protein
MNTELPPSQRKTSRIGRYIVRGLMVALAAIVVFGILLPYCLEVVGEFVGNRQIAETQGRIADAVQALPVADSQLTLYSLYPYEPLRDGTVADGYFHAFRILGQKEISDVAEKKRLIRAFADSIRKRTANSYAACFNPRHGLRIGIGNATCDFLICFECENVKAFNFPASLHFPVKKRGEREFNAVLDIHGLERAPKRD